MTKEQRIHAICQAMQGRKFHEWYQTTWDDFVTCHESIKPPEEILKDIEELFSDAIEI